MRRLVAVAVVLIALGVATPAFAQAPRQAPAPTWDVAQVYGVQPASAADAPEVGPARGSGDISPLFTVVSIGGFLGAILLVARRRYVTGATRVTP